MSSDGGAHSAIGAYLLAIGRLRADAVTASAIAGMLGLAMAEDAPQPPTEQPPTPPQESPRTELRPRQRDEVDRTLPRGPVSTTGSGELVAVRVADRTPLTVQPLPQLPPARPFRPVALPLEPLLRRVTTRSIISAVVAVRRATAVLDTARVIERVAHGQSLEPPPWRLVPTTAGAVRILVDDGPGMAQFARDAADLANRVAAVAGRDRTEPIRMWQTPYAADDMLEHRRFPAIPTGSAIVALSDLGIAPAEVRARGIVDAWLRLASELRAIDASLVVFVPYPPVRWPRRLALLRLIFWDRTTGVATVRRVLAHTRSLG